MRQTYTTVTPWYYTVLTLKDSEMLRSDVGDLVQHDKSNVYVNGRETIDQVQLVQHLLKTGQVE